MNAYDKLYINGEWVSPVQGQTFDTIDPSNEQVIAKVASATAEDVDAAVNAARRAFDRSEWPQLPGSERAAVLRRVAQGIRDRVQELATIDVRDNGKPLPEAIWDIEDTAGCFEFYADLVDSFDETREQSVTLADESFSSVARKEPVGVAGAIIPWNFPVLMASWKVAPALAAGCSVVLKPSEVTPLTSMELADIADKAGVPAGVLNVVTGLGKDAGEPLSGHPGVDKLAFTGSLPTGSRIMQTAAKDVRNLSLELGGKSPFIVFDDSDLEAAVEWVMFGFIWNKGEVCSSTSRLLVQKDLYQPLMDRLTEEINKLSIGNGMDEGVLLGPLVNKAQYDKVTEAISWGREEGARLLVGGDRPEGMEKGYFLRPAVFVDVPEDSWIWKEEIFGPVLCVRTFEEENEAVRMANNSRYGLAAAVMSADNDRAERVARRLRAGIIWVNCSQPTFTEAPWGGYKQSGIGRELGEWGFHNYLETKQITRYDSNEPWGWFLN